MKAANPDVDHPKLLTKFGGGFEQVGRLSRNSVLLIACTLSMGFCEKASAADHSDNEQHAQERLYGHLARPDEQRGVFGLEGGIYLPSIEFVQNHVGLELLGRLSDHIVKAPPRRKFVLSKHPPPQFAKKPDTPQPSLDLFEGKSNSTTALPASLMPSK